MRALAVESLLREFGVIVMPSTLADPTATRALVQSYLSATYGSANDSDDADFWSCASAHASSSSRGDPGERKQSKSVKYDSIGNGNNDIGYSIDISSDMNDIGNDMNVLVMILVILVVI